MLNYIEFFGNGFGRDVISADSPEIEGIEGNWPLRLGEDSPNSGDDRIGQVVCLDHRGFERVWAGCRKPDRVGPKSGLSLFTILHFLETFQILSPHGADFPFQMHLLHTQKSELIFRYSGRDIISADSLEKSKESKEIDPQSRKN